MNELIDVIDYLQGNDKNGSYNEIIQEIEDGLLTTEEAKRECITVLKRWQTENLDPYDVVGFLKIQQIINSITD